MTDDEVQMVDRSTEGVIKAWFDYNPETGEITWKEWLAPGWYKIPGRYTNFMRDRAGKPVMFYNHWSGSLFTYAGGLLLYAHHIAWVSAYKKMPEHHIDHVDGNPRNNAINNLRDVPQKINCRNRTMPRNNSSGVTGVTWNKQRNRWQAQVGIEGHNKHLGLYKTIEEAAKARQEFLDENTDLGFTDRHGKDAANANVGEIK